MRSFKPMPGYTPVEGVPVPENLEIHLTEKAARILGRIVGCDFLSSGWFPAHTIYTGLDKSMEPYMTQMKKVGVERSEFYDLVMTLRQMAMYSMKINATIVVNYFYEAKEILS